MFRIGEVEAAGKGLRLLVSGRLSDAFVEELRLVAERALHGGQALTLDLRDVIFVDRAGAELLGDLARRQVALENRPAFVRAWLGLAEAGEQEERG